MNHVSNTILFTKLYNSKLITYIADFGGVYNRATLLDLTRTHLTYF
jgi:hypothetical protein